MKDIKIFLKKKKKRKYIKNYYLPHKILGQLNLFYEVILEIFLLFTYLFIYLFIDSLINWLTDLLFD